MTIYRPENLPVRIAAKIKIDGKGCWLWTGCTTNRYGRAWSGGSRGDGRLTYSHRYVYEFLVGPIPDGLQIDHRCGVKLCCNPAHLEAVTRSVNNLRAHHGQNYIPANTGTQLSLDEILSQPQQIELL